MAKHVEKEEKEEEIKIPDEIVVHNEAINNPYTPEEEIKMKEEVPEEEAKKVEEVPQ